MSVARPTLGVICAMPILTLLTLSGCALRQPKVDQAPEINLQILTTPDPPHVGPAQLTLLLHDPTGAAVEHARLQLRGDMTHPGMAPILREAGEDRPGEYPVGFEWTMAGDWILTVQGDLPDGRQLLRSIPIRVEPNPAAP